MTEESTTETWMCMGRRLMSSGKVYYAWDDGLGGDTRYFQKLRGQPGRRYTVQIWRREDDNVSVNPVPTYVDSLDVDDPQRLTWEALERSDMTQKDIEAAEKRDKDISALTVACAPLHELYRKQVGPSRRAAFLAVVTEMITR